MPYQPPKIIHAGDRFGRLTALEDRTPPQYRFAVACDCGTKMTLLYRSWGISESCGCYRRELVLETNFKHGMSNTRAYKQWYSMVRRCTGHEYTPENTGIRPNGSRMCWTCRRRGGRSVQAVAA